MSFKEESVRETEQMTKILTKNSKTHDHKDTIRLGERSTPLHLLKMISVPLLRMNGRIKGDNNCTASL